MSDQNDAKPTGAPVNGQPQPFRRQVTWGRPPQAVFRAGPLPRGGTLAPLPEPPKPRPMAAPSAGILSGSMIPRAAPSAPSAPASVPTPAVTPPPTAPVPAPEAAAPDLTVRPLPEPEPEVTPAAAAVAAPEVHVLPDVVVEAPRPVTGALQAASARGKSSSHLPLYAGGAVVVLAAVAVGGWMLTRSPAEKPVAPVAPLTSPVAEPVEIATVETPVVAESEPAATPPAPAVAPAATPARTAPAATVTPAPARPATTTAQPTQRPVEAPPPVAIVTQPLPEPTPAAPPPTAAEHPPSDPDAPILTRPQPQD